MSRSYTGASVTGSSTGSPEIGSIRCQSWGLFTRSTPSGSGKGGSKRKCSSGLPPEVESPDSAYTPPSSRSPQPRGSGTALGKASSMGCFSFLGGKRISTEHDLQLLDQHSREHTNTLEGGIALCLWLKLFQHSQHGCHRWRLSGNESLDRLR